MRPVMASTKAGNPCNNGTSFRLAIDNFRLVVERGQSVAKTIGGWLKL
jgi:hypothetical protein